MIVDRLWNPSEIINIVANTLTMGAVLIAGYYRIKSKIELLELRITTLLTEKTETHERIERMLEDHENRLRDLEHE